MLLRVFILIFAFNAVVSSAFARGAMDYCMSNMDKENVLLMNDSSVKLTCNMTGEENSCYSSECLANCIINITSLPSAEEVIFVSLDIGKLHLFKSAHFYQITLPILTPPPLV